MYKLNQSSPSWCQHCGIATPTGVVECDDCSAVLDSYANEDHDVELPTPELKG